MRTRALDGSGDVHSAVCDACGHELQVGDFPFCPHGSTTSGKLADVTWPGGRTFENLAHEPVTFYSKSEYVRFLKQTNQREFVRWAGPTDRHVSRWATMDEYTLNAAKELVTRCGLAAPEPPEPSVLESFEVRDYDVAEA